jgi:hypothetical protein
VQSLAILRGSVHEEIVFFSIGLLAVFEWTFRRIYDDCTIHLCVLGLCSSSKILHRRHPDRHRGKLSSHADQKCTYFVLLKDHLQLFCFLRFQLLVYSFVL